MIKRIFAIAILLAAFSTMGWAQKGLHLGANASVNATFILNQQNWNRTELDYDATIGFGFGAVAAYQFNEFIGAQMEFRFATQGQKYDGDRTDGTIIRDLDFNYFQWPILLRVTTPGPRSRFYFLVGPQFSFITYANEAYSDTRPSFNVDTDMSVKEHFQNSEVGILIELGPDFYITEYLFINFGLRMYVGLTDINADTPFGRLPQSDGVYEKSRNAYGGFNLGVRYILFGSKKAFK